MSASSDSAPAPRTRRARGAAESLASVVLAFESIVAFLAGLAIYGLGVLPETIAPWWGIVAGSVLAVAMIVTGRLVRYPWGIAIGWILQIIVALGAFLVPSLLIVALIFGGMYAYATIKGRALDQRNARLAAELTDSSDEA
ncbi:DUF4233 domain-containing protein [Microbacterium sp. C7(2022)]|uniref:DUF4233 domain-containing protein n=1 Tax=Microbacterium sp. C7(2022) TaxID=2992759 RepID=UPI00237BE74A|nr:DUF4233 domain-containing protein [Microbacterium sp. C7(2022)]MDE0546980.1 DUF4233 domain-containing protein [Microbacterium sp. C7(2022)]